MKFARTAAALLLLAAFATSAGAQTPTTREQVKAELREAIRTGDAFASGEPGARLNELRPERYPRVADAATKTRVEARAELAQAMRDGAMIAAGEGGRSLRDEFPDRYPALAVASGRSRAEVVAETRAANRAGELLATGEGATRFDEQRPQGRVVARRAAARSPDRTHAFASTQAAGVAGPF